MDAFSAILIGLILRFGIPIALTAAVILLLRNLDKRWQQEAEGRIAERASHVPQIRCWVLNDCPEERLKHCPAYAQPNIPCWHVFRDGNGRMPEKCLNCEVFRKAPVPVLT